MATNVDFVIGSALLKQEQARTRNAKKPTWAFGVKAIDAHLKNVLRGGQLNGLVQITGNDETTVSCSFPSATPRGGLCRLTTI
jgi:hypothetical protein